MPECAGRGLVGRHYRSYAVGRMRPTRVVAILFVFSAACADAAGPSLAILSHTLADAAPLVRRLDVRLRDPGPVRVVYGVDEDRLEVESVALSTEHSVFLTRLRPRTRYTYEVITAADVATGEFFTDSLPQSLASVEFTVTGTPSEPLVLLEFARLDGSAGYGGVAIVDGQGSVVWYFPAASAITGTTRRANGNFVFLDSVLGLLEVTPAGEVVAMLAQSEDRPLHHDVIAAPGDVLYALRLDRRMVNDTLVAGEGIWEWDPDRGVETQRWSAFDALDPITDRGLTYSSGDWLHANSLSIGPHANVVVSLHHLDQIISIAPGFGAIEWRLGGTNATIPLSGADRFSGQHTGAEITPGRVLLFDNGFQRSQPYSRGLELELEGSTVHSVWQFRPPTDNWSRAVGGARRLANGNTLLTFGMSRGLGGSTGPIEVHEATGDGTVVWRLEVGGNVQILYRATALATIGGERMH